MASPPLFFPAPLAQFFTTEARVANSETAGRVKESGRTAASLPARFWLVALVLAVAAPAILVTGYLLMRYAEAERARLEEQVRDEARTIASALDRRFTGMIEAVQVLALTQDFDAPGIEEFRARAARARGILGRNIVLRNLEGRQIVNPRLQRGRPLPGTLRPTDKALIETGRPQVSDVFESPVDNEKIVSISIPIVRAEKLTYILNLAQELSYFDSILSEIRKPADHIAVIMDSHGVIVARSRDSGMYAGRPGVPTPAAREGAQVAADLDGARSLIGWATSDISGWRAVVSVRHQVIDAPRRRALNTIAIVGSAVILLGFALAWGVGARISRSLRLLTQASAALGARAPVPLVRTHLAEVNDVGRALRKAEERLEDNEARLERALVAAKMYSFEWSLRDQSVTRSASASVVLGDIAPDLRHGTRTQLRDRVHPQDRLRFAHAVENLTPEAPNYSVEFRFIRPDGETVWLQTSGVAEFSPFHEGVRVTGFTRDITSRKEAEIRQSLLVRELHHRVKNNLATVLALANLSSRDAVSVEDYKTKLRARIQSMARSHSLLNESSFHSAFLRTLLQDELEPYAQGDGERIRIEGADVDLTPEAALALGMAVHELATNAGKYGSLSCERGRLHVSWRVVTEGPADAERRRLRIVWRESDGPPVTPPARKGFGSRLLESVIGEQLKGHVDLRYEPEGLVAVLEASLDGAHAREASTQVDA